MELLPVGSDSPKDTVKVYQGKNDSVFTDEVKAKKTFFSVQDGYNFDGIYFRNKTDLRQYLDQLNRNSVKSDLFTLKNPSDSSEVSLPVSSTSLSQIDFSNNSYLQNEDYVNTRNFVKNYSNSYVSLKKDNNYKYFNTKDNSILSEVIPYVTVDDIGYTKVYSSQNRATYIVDVSKEDEHGIDGTYFYSGGGNILSSNDKDQWSKYETVDSATNASPIIDVVSSFTDILLNESTFVPEDSAYSKEKDLMLFYFYDSGDLTDPLSGSSLNKEWYDLITRIKENHNQLFNSVIEKYNAIKQKN